VDPCAAGDQATYGVGATVEPEREVKRQHVGRRALDDVPRHRATEVYAPSRCNDACGSCGQIGKS